MVELTIQEKQKYVEEVEAKASAERISIKYASAKLGRKVWAYYKYKAELRAMERGAQQLKATVGEGGAMETSQPERAPEVATITINLSPDVMAYLESEAEGYATSAGVVAQLLLHDVVRGKIKAAKQ